MTFVVILNLPDTVLTWTEESRDLAIARVTACMSRFPSSRWSERQTPSLHNPDLANVSFVGRVYG